MDRLVGFVRTLDLSFNLLKTIPEGLASLTSLRTIYFVQNRISKISGLESCINLRSLELGGNKIRVCRGSCLLLTLMLNDFRE